MKIVFFGTPEFVIPVLQNLNENFEVVGVVTAPDRLVGRKQLLTPSPIAQFWHELVCFKPEKLSEVKEDLKKLEPDLFIVASYGKIIPQSVLDIPKFGSLNIHPSLLPKYRGPSPIQSAILAGDKITGVTILVVDKEMDHGPIVYTKEISLSNTDTFDILSKKMFAIGAELLVKIIPDFISGKIIPEEQNHEQATFTKMFTKEDGYFDPPVGGQVSSDFLEQLDRKIRAYYPWPTAWTKWINKIVKFLPEGLVQIEGKKPVKLSDFLRGYPNFPIKNLD